MEKIILTGKNLTEDQHEEGRFKIIRDKLFGRQEVGGELRKKPEDFVYIAMINEFIAREFKKIDIESDKKLLPEQIHFLKENEFVSRFGQNDCGLHDTFPDAIYINDERLARHHNDSYNAKVCDVMLHEAIHKFSFTRYHLNHDEGLNHDHYSTDRYGYVVENPLENEHRHFQGFNEAIIEKITLEIIAENKENISKLFNISEKEWEAMYIPYKGQMQVLDSVINGVAAYFKESPEEIWAEIKRGLFTGKLLHLKKIEECFGKGSLRVLAAMDNGTKTALEGTPPEKIRQFRERMNGKILEYFNTADKSSRSQIAHEVLNERERLKYIKVKE